MRLATCRRSRFCVSETLSVFRCLFVPSQVHYLPLAGESVPSTCREWIDIAHLPIPNAFSSVAMFDME